MPQSLSNVIIHVIFSTKDRIPYLEDKIIKKFHAYIATIVRDLNGNAFRVGGTRDHLHIAASLPRTMSQSDFVKKIKCDTSKWIKGQNFNNFYWQRGYGVFSVSYSALNNLINYIDNQEVHHRKRTFKEEFLEFLNKYRIKYDEKYVWD